MPAVSLNPDETTERSYVSLRELAAGGMGKVFLAVRKEGDFRRLYALKRLHSHLKADEAFRTMFMDEARIAGLISHPNVVGVIDVGEDAMGPFLVMDYVEGVSLAQLIRTLKGRSVQIPMQIALRIASDIARGLQAAHEQRSFSGDALQLVHRDVSPQNVLLGFDGSVRVTDFGVAKALGRRTQTVTGTLKGKFGYMAPEQLMYQDAEQRSDLYSLGVVIFELLAGRRLHGGSSSIEAARKALFGPTPDIGDEREDASDDLVALLFALLAKEPEKRPQSAGVVLARLDELVGELVSEEGALDPRDFVREHFEQEQERCKSMRQEALAEHERVLAERVTQARGGRGRLAAAALALLLISGTAAFALRDTAAEPADVQAPPAVAVPTPPPPVAVQPIQPDMDVADEASEEEPAVDESSARRNRRRRRVARMNAGMDTLAAPMRVERGMVSVMTDMESWGWQ